MRKQEIVTEDADVLMERAHEYASAVERAPGKAQGLAVRRSQGRGAR